MTPAPAVKRVIEQQHTLDVTAILVRALGQAAPKLDHSCVVVEQPQPETIIVCCGQCGYQRQGKRDKARCPQCGARLQTIRVKDKKVKP